MASENCRFGVSRSRTAGLHLHFRRACRTRLNARALGVPAVRAVADVEEKHPERHKTTIVVGGGPCGLAAAMYLSQMGWRNIEVWDRLSKPEPPDDGLWGTADRSYNVILSGKGQAALRELDVYDRVIECCAPSNFRQEWTPERPAGNIADNKDKPTPQVIQRDRLVACMLEHIEEEHAGRVHVRHNMQVQGLAMREGDKVSLQWSQESQSAEGTTEPHGTTETDFVVGADGTSSTVRTLLEEQGVGNVRSVSLEEKQENTRVYKTIVIPVQHTEYSAPDGTGICRIAERSAAGRVIESLPTKEGNQLALVLFKADDEEALQLSSVEEAAAFLEKEFPNMYPLIPRSEVEAFAERPPNKLPTFQYTWPQLHYSTSVVLAGDAIHTVKPYFGLGVNSALDDVRWLRQCLLKHPGDRAAALELYSRERALDAQALVVESHKADQSLWNLVFPLVMDKAFSKLFPGLFRGSMFKSMQLEGVRFNDVRRRKRLDRVVQFSMIGGALAAVCTAVV